MKSESEAIEFLKYINEQLKCMVKPNNFVRQDYMNSCLLANAGYEDFFVIEYPDKPEPNVGLYKYSTQKEALKCTQNLL